MNRGDWIQLSFLIIIFLVIAVIIYSLMYLPLWIGIAEITVSVFIGWMISKRIKL